MEFSESKLIQERNTELETSEQVRFKSLCCIDLRPDIHRYNLISLFVMIFLCTVSFNFILGF